MEKLLWLPREPLLTITIGALEIKFLSFNTINVSLDWRDVLRSGWGILRDGCGAADGLIRGKHGLVALKILGLGISAGISAVILLQLIREFKEKWTKEQPQKIGQPNAMRLRDQEIILEELTQEVKQLRAKENMAYEAKKADSMRLRDQENILEELTQEVKQLRAEVENMAYEAKKADSMSPVDIIEPTNKELQNTQPGANFTQAELLRIAKDILSEWDLIALRTGLFDHDEITNIRQNNSYTDDVRKAMAMLDAYQKRNGTRECLVLALEESQRHDTARKVRSKCYQTIKAD